MVVIFSFKKWYTSRLKNKKKLFAIILPAKSRSDVMFCLQSYGTYLS